MLSKDDLQIAMIGDLIMGSQNGAGHKGQIPSIKRVRAALGPFLVDGGPRPAEEDLACVRAYIAEASKYADYNEIREKAREIYRAGGVDPIRLAPDFSEVNVHSPSGKTYYNVIEIGPGPSIANDVCECPWSRYNFDRSPDYKYLEHKKCAHTLAHIFYLQAFVSTTQPYFSRLPTE